MPARGTELIEIPDWFWQRPETTAALRERNIGRLLLQVSQHAEASQTQIATACGMTQPKISAIMRGSQKVETLAVFERFADALHMPDSARVALGLAPRAPISAREEAQAIPSEVAVPALETGHASVLLGPDAGREQEEEEDFVRRRDFVGLAGASIFTAMLPGSASGGLVAAADPLAPVLTGHNPGPLEAPVDIAELAAAVHHARRDYQASRYSKLANYLPGLLARLHASALALEGDARLRVHALSADAHHVAAGLLLKLDDQGLAHLAADRSMRAARASEDPS